MNNKKLFLRLIRPFIHFIIINFTFYIVFLIRQKTDLIPFIHLKIPYLNLKETLIFGLIASIVFITLGYINWLYNLTKPIHWYYKKLFSTSFVWFIFISFISYFWHDFIFKSWISRLIIIWWWIFSTFFIIISDIIINNINSKLEKLNPYKILLIYKSISEAEKIEKILSTYPIYNIAKKNIKDIKIEKDDINLIKLPFNKYDVIITIWNIENTLLQQIADRCRIKWKSFYHIDNSIFLEDLIYEPVRLGPLLALEYKPSPLEWRKRVIKRIFDISFSLIFILLFWWLYLLIALFIWLKDWRPIIYKSKRVWRWWKIFEMYKFRTMIKNADKLKWKLINMNERKWPLFKLTNDPRITSWGKFLRKTSLDEIPQFFNVLKWEMSLVGPRPHLPEEVSKYKRRQKRLLSVKPWITWYAQIFWRDNLDFDEEAKLDLYYIQNWNIWLDLYIIFMTLKVITSGR